MSDREIKFRGKRVVDGGVGDWVYGFLAAPDQIMVWDKENGAGEMFAVHPDTVGQYTGLKDKRLREVYAGDIYEGEYGMMVVVWSNFAYGWRLESVDNPARSWNLGILNSIDYPYIGTIHDKEQ